MTKNCIVALLTLYEDVYLSARACISVCMCVANCKLSLLNNSSTVLHPTYLDASVHKLKSLASGGVCMNKLQRYFLLRVTY